MLLTFKKMTDFMRLLLICGLCIGSFQPAIAADVAPVSIIIKDHKFSPSEIHLPTQQAVEIQVENKDSTAEEFESSTLGVEKVIIGEGRGVVRIHPLSPGHYPFIGEYHADTAKGVVIVE